MKTSIKIREISQSENTTDSAIKSAIASSPGPGYIVSQELLIVLIRNASPECVNSAPLLDWAYAHGNCELVQYLLAAGAKVTTPLIRKTLLPKPEIGSTGSNLELRTIIRKAILHPCSLLHLARLSIRSSVSSISKIDALQLPDRLLSYLKLEDLG